MLIEERNQLFLERNLAVMLLLTSNISMNLLKHRPAHAEHGISRLPTESARAWDFLVHPARRATLDEAHHLGDRCVRRNRDQHVNVISRPVDDMGDAAALLDDRAHVGKEPRLQVIRDSGTPLFRREDDVNKKVRKAVRHRFVSPFQGSAFYRLMPTAEAVGYILSPLRGYTEQHG